MPRSAVFLICTLVAVLALAATTGFSPRAALAAPAMLQFDTSLQDAPRDDANSLSWVAAGTEVYVTGDPVSGYVPVTIGVLIGWVRGDALAPVESSAPEPVPGAATPIASADLPDTAPTTAVEAAAPLDPNAPSVAVPDPGPVGPAAVLQDVSIYAGPGSDYGVLGTAPVGQIVEQTGHAVSGYVTVRYIGVTGWVPLDHLGPAPALSGS